MNPVGEVRLKLVLQYDGSQFFGWQIQKKGRTVQGELQAALEKLTGAPRAVLGSGRTDRGVHAHGQVAAVTVPSRWSAAALKKSLNAVLDDDIWISDVLAVHDEFQPRFDAIARTYTYRVGIAPESISPFFRRWCWPLRTPLELDDLNRAANVILGTHSFEAFAKAGQPERGYVCTIASAEWAPWSTVGVALTVTADRYLHHMVRYLVGTMVDIARDRRPITDLSDLLEDPTSGSTSPPAPSEGLFLTRVAYPAQVEVVDASSPLVERTRTR